ncbi:hypothetical protein ACHAWF_011365 [Thalassiosira exigua]
MTAARHQCDETEHNFVADAFNWEQRVRGESAAARAWSGSWGDVFAPGRPKTRADKIEALRKEMEKLPVQAMMSNSQMSYAPAKPYKECGKNYGRRSISEDS